MQLSQRLLAVSNMVTSGSRLADVGTDHGYIPLYLAEQNRISHAIAMDINQGPLLRAQENIKKHGLAHVIETRLSDGLQALAANEADSVVIAGMGGVLMIKILSQGAAVLETVSELILQPQSEVAEVRRFLCEHNYRITAEQMILEDGKYYPMFRAVHGRMAPLLEIEYKYGPFLLAQKNECLRDFLEHETHIYEAVKNELRISKSVRARIRVAEIEKELRVLAAVKEKMT